MTNITRHPLLRQAYNVIQAIEMCGGSRELTAAVTMAGDLMDAIDKHVDALDALKKRDSDLIGQELNNARTMAWSIQVFVEEGRIPNQALYRTDREAKEITDAAVRIEELLADAVRKLRPES